MDRNLTRYGNLRGKRDCVPRNNAVGVRSTIARADKRGICGHGIGENDSCRLTSAGILQRERIDQSLSGARGRAIVCFAQHKVGDNGVEIDARV